MKYLIYTLIFFTIGYLSIDIKPLDKVQNITANFDAEGFSKNFMEVEYPKVYNQAVDINNLVEGLQNDKEKTISQFGRSVALGNIKYFLIKGIGTITKIDKDELFITIGDRKYILSTEFIYGAAVRDAGGLFDIKKFPIATEVQSLTGEINKFIRNNVVKQFKSKANEGDKIDLIGAVEINQAHFDINQLQIQPIKITILNQ
jgi:hypothetical protein